MEVLIRIRLDNQNSNQIMQTISENSVLLIKPKAIKPDEWYLDFLVYFNETLLGKVYEKSMFEYRWLVEIGHRSASIICIVKSFVKMNAADVELLADVVENIE